MKKTCLGILAILMTTCLAACGGFEEKAYGLWLNEDRRLVTYYGQVSYSAFELTKDTYRTNLLSTPPTPRERAVYYETSNDQIVVRDFATKEAVLILRDVRENTMTVIDGEPATYTRAPKSEIEEIRRAIAAPPKRR